MTSGLSRTDRRVLATLPMDVGCGRWLTPAGVALELGVAEDVARSCMRRLRGRGLAEDDGEYPLAFARTRRGEVELERAS